MADRVFLFLQSHPSFIGRSLINQMRSQGVECHIVNLSLSDWLSRLGLGAKNYMGKLENWRDYLRNFIECNAITDIVYYQDQRPYHRIARSLAHEMKLNTYVYEFGYFRPDWVTLEKGGMGPFSHFPNNPEQIMRLASKLDERVYSTHYPYPFFAEAFFEVVYHMMPRGFPFVFRHYKNDRYYHPWFDFPSYIPRLLRSKSLEISAQQTIDSLVADETEFFVIPMQLQSDYQIRRASHYGHMSEMVEEVISSFKKNANKDAALVFKVHPLDNNIERWPRARIALSPGPPASSHWQVQ